MEGHKKHLPREEERQVLITKADEEEEMSALLNSGLKEEEGDSPELFQIPLKLHCTMTRLASNRTNFSKVNTYILQFMRRKTA